MEKRARNLYVIASAIIVYLLAGADLNHLSALGLRAPARYPIVFSWAAVVALLWFAWRYHVTWLSSNSRANYRNRYLKELHQLEPFVSLVRNAIEFDAILKAHRVVFKKANPNKAPYPPNVQFNGFEEVPVHHRPGRPPLLDRRSIFVSAIKVTGGANIGKDSFPDSRFIKVDIPPRLHWRHSLPHFLRREVWRPDFADMRLPYLVLFLALALVACRAAGGDPAGFWGGLSAAEATSNSPFPSRPGG